MFPKYKLTDKQIKGIACIVAHEQGSWEGRLAEISQICNRCDIKGDQYATDDNLVKTVTSGWYAHGKSRYEQGTSNAMAIKAVKIVACGGYRTLPRYIDEHDCMSDISSVKNGIVSVIRAKTKWIPHKTIIKNKMSSKYIFYSFPGGYKSGVDPFGYTSRDNRKKFGDFCFTAEEASAKDPISERLINDLAEYDAYIKKHSKKFINEYVSSINTFDKAQKLVKQGKKVGITCVVPLRWALYDLGIKTESGKYLISAPDGSFEKYYTGDVKKHLKRITSGAPIGDNIVNAINKGLLRKGDIVAYKGRTHTSVYSGKGYKFYEGGGSCVKDGHYPDGILVDYSKNFYKDEEISEILRWKGQVDTPAPSTDKDKTKYTGKLPALPSRGYYKLDDGIKTLTDKTGEIKKMQALINFVNGGNIKTDGKFGQKTKDAVKAAQGKLGIKKDGLFGKNTLEKCKSYSK